jgi:hypothetical protein
VSGVWSALASGGEEAGLWAVCVGETDTDTFWDRLAARSQRTRSFAVLEEPTAIVRVTTVSLWASVVLTWLGGVSFHRFDEPAAG